MGTTNNIADTSRPVTPRRLSLRNPTPASMARELGDHAGKVWQDLHNLYTRTALVAAPTTPTSNGTPGQWAYAAGVMYLCVASNVWVKWSVTTTW